MKTKNFRFEELYKTILKGRLSDLGYDIWSDTDLTETKIEYFFDRLFEKDILFELFSNNGEVTSVYDAKPIKGGLEFKFENVINDVKFYTLITLFKCEHMSNKLKYDIIDLIRNKQNVDEMRKFKELLDNNKDNLIIGFRFEDESQLTSLTGKMGNKASTVFSSIYRNIRNVLLRPEYANNIIAYYCLVNKKERKRIDLYKEIMKRTVKPKNYLIDEYSDLSYDILYFW